MRDIIRKVLREALGVPNNLVNVAKDAWDEFKREFKTLLDDNILEYDFYVSPSEPYMISDMPINEINYIIKLHPTNKVDKPEFINFAVHGQVSRELGGKRPILLHVDKGGKTILSIEIAVPEDWTTDEVMGFIEKNRVSSVSSFSHELKHEYDEFKKPHSTPESRISYNNAREMMATFPPLREFAFYLYFTHEIESLVRPSEVAAALDVMGITKKQFIEFLFNNKTYKQLKEISEFSVKQMKKDLLNYIGEIRQTLENVDDEYSDDMSDDDVINRILEITYITMVNKKGSEFLSTIAAHPLEQVFGLPARKSKWMDNYISKITKYENNPLKYFEDEEKEMKIISKNMMRKLSKLYDLAKNNPSD